MNIKNYIKIKLQNWLLDDVINDIDIIEDQLLENRLIGKSRLNVEKALGFLSNEYLASDCNLNRIKGLELAHAQMETYTRALHKEISLLMEEYYKRLKTKKSKTKQIKNEKQNKNKQKKR